MNDSDLYLQAAEIVNDVLDRGPANVDACARELCGDNAKLLNEVLTLLALHAATPAHDPFADTSIEAHRKRNDDHIDHLHTNAHAGMPDRIGSYRVIREIGRGGMGVVYECEQPSPRRRVAIKLVDGLRSSEALDRRFTAEAELQGRLQHPGIAQIYDAGAADVAGSRRPYFIMELVSGKPLRMHADTNSLSIPDRLALVARVADGIAHAHDHDSVPRDLKHVTILVTGAGQPKVLDFGIARFIGDTTAGAMTITNEGQILGTIGYMAPEQLDGTLGTVGPPADVYALGVILYELIAGVPPHDLNGLSIGAALRMLDQQTPPPLRSSIDRIDRDIDTIVQTCLDRDPGRRYHDAGELAADLRRTLAKQPIVARPPSKRYLTKMFVKRHRALVASVAAILTVLLVGVAVSSLFAFAEREARLIAQQQERLAQEREIAAISGLLSGATALRDADRLWQARRQLSGVDPGSRGWEWRHAALALPWVIDIGNTRQIHEDS
ncbi:MAG: serine/threonine-protein kinase, partial [Planctomycetota bacterium]